MINTFKHYTNIALHKMAGSFHNYSEHVPNFTKYESSDDKSEDENGAKFHDIMGKTMSIKDRGRPPCSCRLLMMNGSVRQCLPSPLSEEDQVLAQCGDEAGEISTKVQVQE